MTDEQEITPAEQRVLDAICRCEDCWAEDGAPERFFAALREYGAEQRAVRCEDAHCWVSSGEVLLSDPPQSLRYCRHCGKQQVGRAQDTFVWKDR